MNLKYSTAALRDWSAIATTGSRFLLLSVRFFSFLLVSTCFIVVSTRFYRFPGHFYLFHVIATTPLGNNLASQ